MVVWQATRVVPAVRPVRSHSDPVRELVTLPHLGQTDVSAERENKDFVVTFTNELALRQVEPLVIVLRQPPLLPLSTKTAKVHLAHRRAKV